MKKVLLLILCVSVSMAGFAKKKKKGAVEPAAPVVEQMTDEECLESISIFQSAIKMGDWAGAYEAWLPLYQKRPDYRSQIYTSGNKILEYRYSQAQTDAERLALRDSIMKLYDDRIKYFDDAKYPDAYVLGQKAKDYLTYFPEDSLGLQAYEWMKESVAGLAGNTPVDVVRKFMELTFKIFQSDQEKYAAQFETDYELVGNTLDAIVASGQNVEPAQSVKAYADRMFAASGAADCATMDEKFASKVAESAGDIETLTSIVKLYRRMGCLDSKVYFDASQSIHNLKPTAESAAGCAQMCLKKGDKKGGISYYQQALNLATTKDDKADYLYRLANIYVSMGSYQQGASYANQALAIDPDNGRCYLLLAMCYGSARLSNDPVLGRAVFWVACDMCIKAKQVDSSCARDADRLYAKYRAHFPSKEDIFFSKDVNEGSSYFVGGWIGRSTIVRSR